MKAHVFISVLAFHIVVIAGLYLLSACSTSNKTTVDQNASSTSGRGSIYDQYSEPNRPTQDDDLVVTEVSPSDSPRNLDPAFNSGSSRISSPTANTSGGRYSPTRPNDGSYATSGQPVLNEFREDEILQPLTTSQPVTPVVEYQVKKGDSLWKISRDFGISLKELMEANGLLENSTIQVGQKLVVSAVDTGPPSIEINASQESASSQAYTIVKGDTLSRIAKNFNTSINDIRVANNLRSDVIQLGQKLTIPINSLSSGDTSQPTTQPKPQVASIAPPASSGAIIGDIVHTVESGDTPSGIAKLYGITTSQLMNDNNIQDARAMRVGQQLQIRLGVAQPTATTGTAPTQPNSQPVKTPTEFDNSFFDDLEEIPEVEIVPRS